MSRHRKRCENKIIRGLAKLSRPEIEARRMGGDVTDDQVSRVEDIQRDRRLQRSARRRAAMPTKTSHMEELRKEIIKVLKSNDDLYVHFVYRTDSWITPTSEANLRSYFELVYDITCDCAGGSKTVKAPHKHIIGKYVGQEDIMYVRTKFRRLFKDKKAYMIKMIDKGTPEGCKKLVSSIIYIQTEKGWHIKTAHTNPFTIETLKENKDLHKIFFGRQPWAQYLYMQYLARESVRLQRVFATNRQAFLAKKINTYEKTIHDLRRLYYGDFEGYDSNIAQLYFDFIVWKSELE